MCNHDWEFLSMTADGTGDRYEYYICRFCGEEKEVVVDELNR